MKKLKCSSESCDGTFGHLLSEKTLDIMRQKQQFIITGKDYTVIGTCGKCGQKSTFSVIGGKFDETDAVFKPPKSENPQPVPQT